MIRNIVKPNIYTRFNIEFMKVIKLAKVIHSESIFDLNKICFKTYFFSYFSNIQTFESNIEVIIEKEKDIVRKILDFNLKLMKIHYYGK